MVIGLVAMLLVGWPVAPGAQERSEEGVGYSTGVDLEQYQPVVVSRTEREVSAPLMVSLAYGLMWLAVLVFVWLIWRRGQRLSDELLQARSRLLRLERRVLGEGDPPGIKGG